jgi:type I restriction enzyme M protein
MSINILKYESDVWRTADLLIGAGIKQSDFPKYMMPYFALLMVESRLIREANRLEEEIGKDNIEDFVEEFQLAGLGYNDYIIRKGKSLKDICKNDKAFDSDFHLYLKSFDPETKYLLGVDKGTEDEKFLDISGISGQLKKKRILFETVQAWSEIDLTPFNNSEITTLEEHIKRKWADISAETAGEQYTPDDIISLISELIASKIEDNGKFLTIYDPTCGGGNLLFGVEDKIKEKFKRPTKTFGEDWSDSLYALAKIESRFRADSEIKYGNTLTNISFIEKRFDVVVANPPYGVDWKGYQKDIQNDTTERFVALPSISDGQFLFTQHILYQLDNDGFSVVVHNGSTLFSGDAGSGESTIRKHFFDNDWVESIIQMPTDEFFNTGIYTYLWIFNKNKPAERKDKVILINASELYEGLKKSKGKKRKQMNLDNRTEIVKAFTDFKDNEFCKVFDKWHFYYNRQSIMLTNVDINGKFIEMPIKEAKGEKVEAKSIKLDPVKITVTDEAGTVVTFKEFEITAFDKAKYPSLDAKFNEEIKPNIAILDYKEQNVKISTKKATYWYDSDKDTIIEEIGSKQTELGCGKIVIKSAFKKASKSKNASIIITVELTKDLQKDYEIIPYSPIENENQQTIASFMNKYVTKPFEYVDNLIGVEINFNKVFYTPEKLRELSTINSDLIDLENELSNLENELGL